MKDEIPAAFRYDAADWWDVTGFLFISLSSFIFDQRWFCHG
jgi:hypothetical protein